MGDRFTRPALGAGNPLLTGRQRRARRWRSQVAAAEDAACSRRRARWGRRGWGVYQPFLTKMLPTELVCIGSGSPTTLPLSTPHSFHCPLRSPPACCNLAG